MSPDNHCLLLTDGEQVVDVPPKLRPARVFATGQGRKTDATDAHSAVLVATRMGGLRPVVDDQQLAVLRILVDRHRSLGEDHSRMISQVHQLLLELIPGGAKKDLSAAQAKASLVRVRPRDAAGKTRRRGAAELISDVERIYQRRKATDKELRELVAATGTSLLDLKGIGPSGAARLLVELGGITRFPEKNPFASWNGIAQQLRINSPSSPARSLFTSSGRADWSRAIALKPFVSSLMKPGVMPVGAGITMLIGNPTAWPSRTS